MISPTTHTTDQSAPATAPQWLLITDASVQPLTTCPEVLHDGQLLWVVCHRAQLEAQLPSLQAVLQRHTGSQLLDLHISDLLNEQIPSVYDYTHDYEVLIFRELEQTLPRAAHDSAPVAVAHELGTLHTQPTAFVVWERVLLSVHSDHSQCHLEWLQRVKQLSPASAASATRSANTRLPTVAADLALRLIDRIVQSFLELRRQVSPSIEAWQTKLLSPQAKQHNWTALLQARLFLHQLSDVCDDQRNALQAWMDDLEKQNLLPESAPLIAQELLLVRTRDVLEHIDRMVQKVASLEKSIETTIQIHFSAQSDKANAIMRVLTVITAIFMPLNLIVGFFGMNFDFLPLIHSNQGFWWTFAMMLFVALGTTAFFWRKRYLRTRA